MLEVRYVLEHALRGERGTKLLEWLLRHGADEFTVVEMEIADKPAPNVDAFERALKAWSRPAAIRRMLTAATAEEFNREVPLWEFSAESIGPLLQHFPKGLFHWPVGDDGWLEDLTIYRHRELIFGVVSHEDTAVLRLTPDEHASVAAMGIPSEPTADWIGY